MLYLLAYISGTETDITLMLKNHLLAWAHDKATDYVTGHDTSVKFSMTHAAGDHGPGYRI